MTPSTSPAESRKSTLVRIALVPSGRGDRRRPRPSRLPRRLRQLGDAAAPRGSRAERFRQAPDAVARRDKAPPVGDRGLDRRQRASHHDGGGDHRAGGHLLPDHQVGAEAEDCRLHQQPQHLGDAAEGIDHVARAADRRRRDGRSPSPIASARAPDIPIETAEVDVAPAGLGHGRAQAAAFVDGARVAAAGALGLERHRDQDDGARQRQVRRSRDESGSRSRGRTASTACRRSRSGRRRS